MLYNVKDILIQQLEQKRKEIFPESPAHYMEIISDAVHTSLHLIGGSDAMYHDVEHTCLVTLCGLEIFAGKKILEGELNAEDWLHYTLALLFHDIGYVKNILREDDGDWQVKNKQGEKYQLQFGSTDASLTPYHVERGQIFISERQWSKAINQDRLKRFISFTQFPVPERLKSNNIEDKIQEDLASLVGSADLIGQLADPMYDIKIPRLFYEFKETGSAEKMGYSCPGDLRRGYPGFFINFVRPHITEALKYLNVTENGRKWTANLNYHVFSQSHKATVEQSGIELLSELTKIANSELDNRGVVQEVLNKVSFYKGWSIAHAYEVFEIMGVTELHSTKLWSNSVENNTYNEFQEISEQYIFKSGEGLPGRVFEANSVQTIYDVMKDSNFPRSALANDIGVRGAFAFPLMADGHVKYVLEFFSPEPEHLDPSVLELLKHASKKLSQRLSKND